MDIPFLIGQGAGCPEGRVEDSRAIGRFREGIAAPETDLTRDAAVCALLRTGVACHCRCQGVRTSFH